MLLPCHERSSLSSPTWQPWQPGWPSRTRLFFGSADAAHATRFSSSVAPVIAVSVIAVRNVASQLVANNGDVPTVAINTALRAVSIIATVSGNTANAARSGARRIHLPWCSRCRALSPRARPKPKKSPSESASVPLPSVVGCPSAG